MKEIKLSQRGKYNNLNLVALVDDEDFEWLNQWNWSLQKGRQTYYAKRTDYSNGKREIRMHRQILGLKERFKIGDHKDLNGLNNQRNNLRIATPSQNAANKSPLRPSTSKYIGVSWKTEIKKWRVHMSCNNKAYHVGYFDNEIDAALAYNKKAIELHGEFAHLNQVA